MEAFVGNSLKISGALKKRAAQIEVLLMDVDGTMTDGGVTLLSQTEEISYLCASLFQNPVYEFRRQPGNRKDAMCREKSPGVPKPTVFVPESH